MCCFSIPTPTSFWRRWFAPKLHVSATNIFARAVAPGVQALVYSMNLATSAEVAMILPIPVRLPSQTHPGAGDDALRFVDLQKHPQMFAELEALFELEQPGPPKGGLWRDARPTLRVHEVGSFIATYVPSRVDFDRVDRRFWLPRVLFDSVPAYADYGFAVFQLKPGTHTIHPMAFTFPSREPGKLYFPTVHVHDGRFASEAKFDHSLYYQRPHVRDVRDSKSRATIHDTGAGGAAPGDAVTSVPAAKDYEGLVDTTQPLVKRTVRGTHPNRDIWIETAPAS